MWQHLGFCLCGSGERSPVRSAASPRAPLPRCTNTQAPVCLCREGGSHCGSQYPPLRGDPGRPNTHVCRKVRGVEGGSCLPLHAQPQAASHGESLSIHVHPRPRRLPSLPPHPPTRSTQGPRQPVAPSPHTCQLQGSSFGGQTLAAPSPPSWPKPRGTVVTSWRSPWFPVPCPRAPVVSKRGTCRRRAPGTAESPACALGCLPRGQEPGHAGPEPEEQGFAGLALSPTQWGRGGPRWGDLGGEVLVGRAVPGAHTHTLAGFPETGALWIPLRGPGGGGAVRRVPGSLASWPSTRIGVHLGDPPLAWPPSPKIAAAHLSRKPALPSPCGSSLSVPPCRSLCLCLCLFRGLARLLLALRRCSGPWLFSRNRTPREAGRRGRMERLGFQPGWTGSSLSVKLLGCPGGPESPERPLGLEVGQGLARARARPRSDGEGTGHLGRAAGHS